MNVRELKAMLAGLDDRQELAFRIESHGCVMSSGEIIDWFLAVDPELGHQVLVAQCDQESIDLTLAPAFLEDSLLFDSELALHEQMGRDESLDV